MQFDDVYEYIGHMGVFQFCLLALVCGVFVYDVEAVTMVFVGGKMDHWCRVEELVNKSFAEQRELAIPRGTDGVYSSCTMYDYNYTMMFLINSTIESDVTAEAEHDDFIDCKEWIYDKSMFSSTVVSRFDLVCKTSILNELTSTIYMLGGLLGSVAAGALSDRFGRKRAFQIFFSIRVVAAGLCVFAINYPMLVTGRFVLGVGGWGCHAVLFVLILEIVGPKYRSACSCTLQIVMSVSVVVISTMAYLIRDDFKYQVAFFAPILVFLPFVFLLAHESPRWLYTRGKYEELNRLFQQMAAVNNRKLPDNFDSKNFEKHEKKTDQKRRLSWTDVLKARSLRMRVLAIFFTRFALSVVYYSLMLNAHTLPGNLYVNTAILGAVETPGLLLGTWAARSKRLGRRWSSGGSIIITGLANFVCIPLIIYGFDTATTVVSLLGKVSLMALCAVIVVYTSELFPTEVRNFAIGAAYMCSRIGSTIAPYMGSTLSSVWKPLPSTIMGFLATVAGCLLFLLPETMGKPYCDTVQELEDMQRQLKQQRLSITLSVQTSSKDIPLTDLPNSNYHHNAVCNNGIKNPAYYNNGINHNGICNNDNNNGICDNGFDKSKTKGDVNKCNGISVLSDVDSGFDNSVFVHL